MSKLNFVYRYFTKSIVSTLNPNSSLSKFIKDQLGNDFDGNLKKFIIKLLKASDFNIENVELRKNNENNELFFQHKTDEGIYDLPENYESRGTIRFMGMAIILDGLLNANLFISSVEIESSRNYCLSSYLIKVFLAN